MKNFADIGICRQLTEKVAERGIKEATEVQERTIPAIASGADIAFRSATGTGKTFAYLLPLSQLIATPPEGSAPPSFARGPVLVIVAPTYELCAQIKAEADFLFSAFEKAPKAALLTGDANISRQIDRLKSEKPAVVVGTPGRMIQLERMGKLKLHSVRFLILDEADRLIADELRELTEQLISILPGDRQTIACSATLTRKAREQLAAFLRPEALREDIDDAQVLRTMIEHWAFYCEGRKKIMALRSFLLAAKGEKTLVFTDRGGQVGNILGQLRHHDVNATGIFGDMGKVERKKAIDDFRAGRAKVLVTSDLSARGLDITDVTHVVALDVPETPEAYAHRAGRTARAGRRGVMATFGDELELPRLAALEKKLGIVVYPKALFGGKIVAPMPVDEDATEAPAEDIEREAGPDRGQRPNPEKRPAKRRSDRRG
ncbi:MAG: DEAD/DEAH box helicase [Treponemataceae bacterium]